METKKDKNKFSDFFKSLNPGSWIKKVLRVKRIPWRQERRVFNRFEEHNLLKYSLPGKSEELSFARNLSPDGMLFHSKDEVSVGSTIDVELNIPKFGKPVKVKLKIVHVDQLKKNDGYNVGGQFINIDEGFRKFLDKEYSVCSDEETRDTDS
ncbi:MAG: PilZ domain-containing protein [Candidatus Omnitrophota bacterium]|nr:PilZ domain-containing protein [Candidatus Omnitrophota bacterium]